MPRRASTLILMLVACSAPVAPRTQDGQVGGAAAGGAASGGAAGVEARAGSPSCSPTEEPSCEACLRECGSAGCAEGRCEVQQLYAPPSSDNAVDFGVGRAHLFWTNADGQMLRSPLDGGDVTVLEDAGDRVQGIAADETNVFWLATIGKTVQVADAAGEGVRSLTTLNEQPVDLAIADAETIYVSTRASGKMLQISRRDGEVFELATTLAGPTFVAASADDVVWADVMAGSVFALDRATGTIDEVASMQEELQGVAVQDGVVYWTTLGAGRAVVKRNLRSTDQAVSLATLNEAAALAIGPSYCYFGSGTGLWRVPLTGGKLQLVASGYERLVSIGVAGAWIYFADFYNGTIARAAL